MPDGNRGGSRRAGFSHGQLADQIDGTAQMIQAWFDDVDYKKYADSYRKLALSGTTGAMQALEKQQVGRTTRPGDPVDPARFFADTWLSSMANAWIATRDINQQFLDDFSRYFGSVNASPPKRTAAKKATKKATKKRAAPRARKPTKS